MQLVIFTLGVNERELAGHSPQNSPSNPKYPVLQRQLVLITLPADEAAFNGHGVHASKPTSDLKEFAAQTLQTHPFSAV